MLINMGAFHNSNNSLYPNSKKHNIPKLFSQKMEMVEWPKCFLTNFPTR